MLYVELVFKTLMAREVFLKVGCICCWNSDVGGWLVNPGQVGLDQGTIIRHTYLAQEAPWSARRSSQGEACPLHSGRADPCDHPKCGWLGCAIFVSRGAASARSPDKNIKIRRKTTFPESCFKLNFTMEKVFLYFLCFYFEWFYYF